MLRSVCGAGKTSRSDMSMMQTAGSLVLQSLGVSWSSLDQALQGLSSARRGN